MAELGFVRNEGARQLQTGRSSALAYMMLDAPNPFFTDVAQGIEDAAAGEGLSLFICDSAGSPERGRITSSTFRSSKSRDPDRPDGARGGDPRRHRAPGYPGRDRRQNPRGGKFSAVAVDDALRGRLAVEHLIDCGHTRVAFIGVPAEFGQIQDRLGRLTRRLGRGGLSRLTSCARLGHRRAHRGRWTRGRPAPARAPRRRRPTAAFCANDITALGFLQQCIAPVAGCPRTSPSSGTTTSSSPPRPPYR